MENNAGETLAISIIKYIRKKYFSDIADAIKIDANTIVIIALSGGMDSMCLLDIFYKLSIYYKFRIIALHIHHGIRDKEADRDAEFVKKYCESQGIEVVIKYVNSKKYAEEKSLTLEEAARILRYNEIHNLWTNASNENIDKKVYVLLAHHMKDQVETIIHNILRGTGIRGIAGMNEKRDYILRPLLQVSKKEICEYVENCNIPYVNDSTNDEEIYTRNYIRKEIIDKFEKVNDKAFEHIVELSKQAKEINDFIENESKIKLQKMILNNSENEIVINLVQYRENPYIIKYSIIREILKALINTLKDITKINIEDVVNLAEKQKGGHIDLPYNITVDKIQKKLVFTKNRINVSMKKRKKK